MRKAGGVRNDNVVSKLYTLCTYVCAMCIERIVIAREGQGRGEKETQGYIKCRFAKSNLLGQCRSYYTLTLVYRQFPLLGAFFSSIFECATRRYDNNKISALGIFVNWISVHLFRSARHLRSLFFLLFLFLHS